MTIEADTDDDEVLAADVRSQWQQIGAMSACSLLVGCSLTAVVRMLSQPGQWPPAAADWVSTVAWLGAAADRDELWQALGVVGALFVAQSLSSAVRSEGTLRYRSRTAVVGDLVFASGFFVSVAAWISAFAAMVETRSLLDCASAVGIAILAAALAASTDPRLDRLRVTSRQLAQQLSWLEELQRRDMVLLQGPRSGRQTAADVLFAVVLLLVLAGGYQADVKAVLLSAALLLLLGGWVVVVAAVSPIEREQGFATAVWLATTVAPPIFIVASLVAVCLQRSWIAAAVAFAASIVVMVCAVRFPSRPKARIRERYLAWRIAQTRRGCHFLQRTFEAGAG
ncbi:hypothetical protein [uncultured Aeromicrobium sp.]|uniref:hypothetical protein n=1 Tax=uncultured Aeromicrobium sp. TaxID=337820 RepID=UPI0025CF37A8|nr:hypothetical protein [uncultured Aeromicrobium sp.]